MMKMDQNDTEYQISKTRSDISKVENNIEFTKKEIVKIDMAHTSALLILIMMEKWKQ